MGSASSGSVLRLSPAPLLLSPVQSDLVVGDRRQPGPEPAGRAQVSSRSNHSQQRFLKDIRHNRLISTRQSCHVRPDPASVLVAQRLPGTRFSASESSHDFRFGQLIHRLLSRFAASSVRQLRENQKCVAEI